MTSGQNHRWTSHDFEELVNAVAAGMPREDSLSTMLGDFRRQPRLVEQSLDVVTHFESAVRDQVIFSGREESLRIVPIRTYEWNAKGERLEHADRRDTRQLLDVWAPRHVHGDAKL